MGIHVTCDYCVQPLAFETPELAVYFLQISVQDYGCVACEACKEKVAEIREAARQFGKRAQKEHYMQLMAGLRKP